MSEPIGTSSRKPRFSALAISLLEDHPPELVVWRTMSGPFTAAQIRASLAERSELGLQWLSDFLRVMRDVFAYRAQDSQLAASVLDHELEQAAGLDKTGFLALIAEGSTSRPALYWSADTGPVDTANMQKALHLDNDLAAAYVACFIHEFKNYLNQRA